MSKPKIFIDGREGTTGLQIDARLARRDDLELLTIDPEKRKDTEARRALLNAADLVFLCLPDGEARTAVSLIGNPDTRVIDASTAHRTAEGWVYGFPELSPEHRAAVAASKRVANPGCHASGLISSVFIANRSNYLAQATANDTLDQDVTLHAAWRPIAGPTFTRAAVIYSNAQVSPSNKVLVGEGYIVSIGVL